MCKIHVQLLQTFAIAFHGDRVMRRFDLNLVLDVHTINYFCTDSAYRL